VRDVRQELRFERRGLLELDVLPAQQLVLLRELRRRLLRELAALTPEAILARSDEGLPKLWVIRQALGLRRVAGVLFRPDLSYAPGHTWLHARKNGRGLDVGLDDLAQRLLTSVTAVELPTPGKVVRRGDPIAVLHGGGREVKIPAPVAGTVARRSVQLGQRVAPGARLMAVVSLERLWVDANFKEAQLRDMRVGQPVRVSADLYGDQVEYHGRVAGLAAGTGGAFALLPPQNATGNWIKVVQRIGVRIAIAAGPDDPPLRAGMSADVRIDTGRRSLLPGWVRGLLH